ncbi:Uncharacterised protein [Moraxella lacunata]|uniref:Uncharacterized protein n=1 Tax=Moraxella lacunata TaxID=477 RepID=A0A1V4GV16_MORLA|nr:hypothetical protein [Moraxella lacunata]OPH36495.1 hypothetical protein B5J94_07125 [Moraxella lacunata]STY99060.1 Uncharacterised protein [Moraxella lacunata]
MQIKYLKPAPNATTGDIKDIATAQAKILIQLGFAEPYNENDQDNDDNGKNGELFDELNDIDEVGEVDELNHGEASQDEPNDTADDLVDSAEQGEAVEQDVAKDETTAPKKRTKKAKETEDE